MRASLAILLLLSIVRSGAVHGQEEVVVPGTVSCAACRIELQRVASLGRLADDVAVHPLTSLAMDSDGRFYVGSTYNEGELAMYDADGTLLRSFGRPGQGPGEFDRRLMRLVVGPGDSIHVFQAYRHWILLPGLEGFVRFHYLPTSVVSAVALHEALVVTPMPTGASDSADLYRVFDGAGELIRSFGSHEAAGVEADYSGLRYLTAASDSTFWASHVNRPQIELWDLRGRRLTTVVLDLDWFKPWMTSEGIRSPNPEPRMGAAWQDAGGRLWATISVPDPDWVPPRARGEIPVTEINLSDVFDAVLLVVDLATGTLIAQRRFETAHAGTHGIIYTVRTSDEDIYVIDVFRATLIR